MNNSENKINTEQNVTLILEKIHNKCEKLETKEAKVIYLKKVMNDCQRIINEAEKIDGKYLDINYLLTAEQDIDEYLIMFLEGLCESTASLPDGQSRLSAGLPIDKLEGKRKTPLVVKQPRARYTFSLTDGDKICDVQIAFGGMKSFKESIKNNITVIEGEENNEEMKAMTPGDTIKIETGISVIVRILECMKDME